MVSTLSLAFKSLKRSKLRTLLTVLGIVIGIAAVIIVMSAGEGLKGLVMDQINAFGSDFIQIEIKVPATAKNSVSNAGALAQGVQVTTLTLDDAKAIGRLPNITNYYALIMGQNVVSYQDQNKTVNYMAVSPAFFDMDQSEIAQGRYYSADEDNELAKVAVIGSKLKADLFGNQDAVGQNLKIGNTIFKVIGVLKERGATFGFDFDELMYVPVQTAQKLLLGIDYIMTITAKMKDVSRQDVTADDITALLRARHEISDPGKDDFSVTTVSEAKDMINTIFNGITFLLIAIAGISLIVGGVGIMSIMYVSVTERTFEIGLRKAVGARKGQILWQFLWEAIIITLLGGLIGIAVGLVFSYLVSIVALQFGLVWHFILPPQSILIAFGFCGAVGLIFGYWPAQKAANLDPIVALGHE